MSDTYARVARALARCYTIFMSVRPIVTYPDQRLRIVAEPVGQVTDEIRTLVDDMAETMYAAPGVGLAAPQVGVSKRVFVVDVSPEGEPARLMAFIDPRFVSRNGELIWEEGCLSFPGIHVDVQRAERVVVQALDREGKPFEVEAEGLLAVALQHENDHLDGVVLVDHVSYFKRRQIERDLKKRAAAEAATG
jgi:peptide deformylase